MGTTAGDMLFPTTANLVQHRLGCRNAGSVDVLRGVRRARSTACPSAPSTSRPASTAPCSASAPSACRASPTSPTAAPASCSPTPRAPRVLRPVRRTRRGSSTPTSTPTAATASSLIQPAGGARYPATHETVDQRHALRQDEGQRGVQGRGADVRRLRRAHPERNGFTADGPRSLRAAPGEPPHHRGGGEAPEAADGARDRQRRALRQHRARPRSTWRSRRRGRPAAASAAISCCSPRSAAASPGARRCCDGRPRPIAR